MPKTTIITLILAFILLNIAQLFAEDNLSSEIEDQELEQEFKWLKAETFVITASKVKEDIKKAPASITVITDRQIRQMGARDFSDVLRSVPGFDTSASYHQGGVFAVRGGWGTTTNNILIMINSHPINNAQDGGALWVHDTLIIDNIKRIEFIRGPGSALYGANAFHGVINIITKEAEDVDGFEITAKGGSWDTQQYNLFYGKTFSDLEVAFNFNYFKTHGFRGLIEEDFQTYLDSIWGAFGFPPASLAPGRTSGDDEKYDVALNLKLKGFTFDGRYFDREQDLPVGDQLALNNKSITSPKDYYLSLSYETSIGAGLELSGKVYRNHLEHFWDWQLHPPGATATTPTGPEIMPNGVLVQWTGESSRTGLEIQATYKLTDSNTVVAGATYEEQKVGYDQMQNTNFRPTPDPYVIIPLPFLYRWLDELLLPSVKKTFKAVFLEDIWDITQDLRLTTGVRYDHYSDFGSEISPRMGLTWEYIKGYDLKLLYGHAFRAPTWLELHGLEGGNPDLDPETIDTYEISLGANFTSSFSGRITLFHKEEDDIIYPGLVGVWKFTNLGKARAQGFEVEAKYDFGKGTYIYGYYEYLSVKSGLGYSHFKAYLNANVRLSRYLNLYVDCNHWDSLNRINPEDQRDDPSSLTWVNATLIAKKFLKGYEGLELRGSVYNLFDKDWSGPVEELTEDGLPKIPNDLPMPGINFLVEMKYRF